MDNKVVKISALVLVLFILLQFVINSVLFYKEYRTLSQLQRFNDFASVISDFLHRTQQERGAAAGYIGSRAHKFTKIYKLKIKLTNTEIKRYFKFLKHYKASKVEIQKNIEVINDYIDRLHIIRKKVLNLQIPIAEELKFYTTMNTNLLTIMDKLVVLTNNEKLVKGLLAYDSFEKAKEKMGIERAIVSGTLSFGEWFKNLYVEYISLLAEQRSSFETFKSMASPNILKEYNKIQKNKIFEEVSRIEKIITNQNDNFGIEAVYWYNTITAKLNLLDKIVVDMYKYNKNIISQTRKNLVFSILMNLGLSLMILLFVTYTLILLKRENKKLFYKATYDQLTGLYNRLFFISEFNIEQARADRNRTKIAVIFIDLDGFKDINDSLGHEIGDEVLKEIAKRLKNSVRKSDIVARFGGDEFLIMLNDIKNVNNISDIAQSILSEIKKPILIKDTENRVSASIGVSIYPSDGQDIQTLVKNADLSMYNSKNSGKDRVSFYENEMSEESDKRLRLKNDIYYAIKENQFELYYQPQIDKYDKLLGIEVLIRWNHPELGIVSPFYFIPLAIEIGVIEEIDLLVMENALKQSKEWLDKGYDIGIVSCNLTVYQLEKGNIVEEIQSMFENIGISSEHFGLEVTEEGIMQNPEKNIHSLKKLKDLGITLSIDDFGTGYSSFAYLKKLPIDKLKIDREFIKDLPQDEDDTIIASAMISLAKQLHLQTVAEGVETSEQKDFVFSHGCDCIQGYFYSKPIPAEEFEKKFFI